MVDSARLKDFWDRWQQKPSPSREFERFRARMTEVAESIWDEHYGSYEDCRKQFALVSGTPCGNYGYFSHSGLSNGLKEAKDEFEVIQNIQFLLWSLETVAPEGLNECCKLLRHAFDLSPTIMIQVIQHGKTATLYPTGVRLLDENLVESNVSWLGRYPEVAKPYEVALRAYMTKDPGQYRTMLDSLRFAVEQLLQAILGNGRTLENQKEEFMGWLKAHDAHGQIGGMYHTLLFGYFAKYQNDAVKHQEDQYTPAEVEFVLYLTGTFLRFMQRLIEQEGPSKALPRPR